jgi:hypothetical protein
MNQGIKMSKCKFYVDETARTVVCVIPDTRYMVHDYIMEHFNFPEMQIVFWNKLDKYLRMPDSFMGKAVCAEEDTWNEETGRLIAFARAKDKCYKSFFRRANYFVQAIDRRLNDMITNFNDFGLNLDVKREKLQAKIDSRLGIEE